MQRLTHVDDAWRLKTIETLMVGGTITGDRERRLAQLLAVVLYGSAVASDLPTALGMIRSHPALREELHQLAAALCTRSEVVPAPPVKALPPEVPLHLHARYRTEEIAAAFDLRSKEGQLYTPQMGVVPVGRFDLLLVTLDKGAKKKLPHLQYHDYALSPRLFHWQSQASTTRSSAPGRRHLDAAVTPLLFVREQSKDDRSLGVAYRFLGSVKRVDDKGERPISITYRLLDGDIPADLLVSARAAVA